MADGQLSTKKSVIRLLLIQTGSSFSTRLQTVLNQIKEIDWKLVQSAPAADLLEAGFEFDLIILELLPDPSDQDYWSVLPLFAQYAPVIVLVTAEEQGLQGLSLGAGDYWVEAELNRMDVRRTLLSNIHRRRAEKHISQSEKRLRHLVEMSSEGISLVDEQGIIIEWNRAQEQITGFSGDEILGQPLWDVQFQLMLPEQKNDAAYHHLKATFTDFLKSGKADWLGTVRERLICRSDGQQRVILVTAFPIKTAIGFMSGSITRDVTQQLQAEEQLRYQAELFRQSFDVIISTDVNMAIVGWNQAAEKMYGWKSSEVIGKTIAEILRPEYPDTSREQVFKDFKKQGYWKGEVIHYTKTGEKLYVLGSVAMLKDAVGKHRGAVGVHTDITARKRTELALQESETRFRTLFEDHLAIMLLIDAETGAIVDANPAACNYYGYSRNHITQLNISDINILSSEHVAAARKQVQIKKQSHFEFRHRLASGEIRDVDVDSSLVVLNGRKVLYAIIHDATERKRAEAALESERTLLSTLINNMPDLIYAKDTASRFLLGNMSVANLMGQDSPADLLGKTDFDFYPAEVANGFYADEQAIITSGKALINYEEPLCHLQTGVTGWSATTKVPLKDAQGQIIGLVGIGRDITERKRTEQALQESERFARSIVDALLAEIAILDENGTILAVNAAWRQFAVANSADLSKVCEGANYLAVLDVASVDDDETSTIINFAAGLRAVMRGERNEYLLEYSCHSPSERRWFVARVTRFSGDGPLRVVIAHENITDRKQAEAAVHKVNEQLLLLNNVISLTSASLDAQTILEVACQELNMMFEALQVMGALLDTSGSSFNVLVNYTTSEFQPSAEESWAFEGGYILKTLTNCQTPLVIPDVHLNTHLAELVAASIIHPDTISALMIPVLVRGKVIGLMSVHKNIQYEFSEDEINLADSVAQAISQSLENSLLHLSVAQHNQQLEQLVEVRTDQLKRLNKRMAAILNHTSDGIMLVRADNSIENTNLSFDTMFAYDRDAAFGQSATQLLETSYQGKLERALQQVKTTGAAQHLQVTAQRRDGTTFDADFALARVTNNENQLVCSIRDITHLKEVERMKDRFISMVSHELRTPITTIVLSALSLKKHYERMTEVQRQQAIERLNTQANVLVEMIEGILDISRVGVRKAANISAGFNMCEAVDKIIRDLQVDADVKKQKFEPRYFAPVLNVPGESLDFERIWRNLIINAIKYSPETSVIKVRIGCVQIETGQPPQYQIVVPDSLVLPSDLPTGTYLIGQVEDQGHGIPPNDLENLFTRFFRGWAAQSNVAGTGLGLALVRDLLNLYGGNIGVVSQINVGSIFSFWLPYERSSSL